MSEQVFLNGSPIVGCEGLDPSTSEKLLWVSPLLGLAAGAAGGAYLARKRPVLGAIGGGTAGFVVAPLLVVLIFGDERVRLGAS